MVEGFTVLAQNGVTELLFQFSGLLGELWVGNGGGS